MLVESKEGEGTKFIIRLPMGSGLPTWPCIVLFN
jgi:hypothetical protein